MSKTNKINAKKTEAKRDNTVSRTQKKERVKTKATPVDQILHLQRTIGNQAVQRLFKSGSLQAKIKIGKPGDKYELEADKVADQVMNMSESRLSRQAGEEEEEKELIQPKLIAERMTTRVQKQVEEEEDIKSSIGGKTEPEKVDDTKVIEFLFKILGILREIAEEPPWKRMTKKRRKLWESRFFWKLKNTTLYRRYKEAEPSLIEDWVFYIEKARAKINSLKSFEQRAYYYRKLNSLTPYYTQMANLDILWKQKAGQEGPWASTCNVTSLAMALNALGVRTTDFARDKVLLARLGQKFGYKSFADLAKARMPDFLQVVVVYRNFSGTAKSPNFDDLAESARGKSTTKSGLTHLNVMVDVASFFNVVEAKRGWIPSYRTLKPILKKKIKNKKKLEKKLAYYTTARYKKEVITKITPWLDAGAQILVVKPKHYVRLENINDKGIIIDDPSKEGKNYPVSWKDANKRGYFYPYLVLIKK
jgi:hypothetical protein